MQLRQLIVLDSFIKLTFYVCAGLALFGALLWYMQSVYETVTGRGDIVILPLTVAGSNNAASDGRGDALAGQLLAHLQQIETDLIRSQDRLMRGNVPSAPAPGSSVATKATPKLALVPLVFFPPQGVALQARLFKPAEMKISVGGVDVGGVIPWLQRHLVTRRTLQLTYYETDHSAIVSGSLDALGVSNGALRVEVKTEAGKAPNLDYVAGAVAMEIERRRFALDPSNRVEVLNGAEFGTLIETLIETAHLNDQTALGRPAGPQFVALLNKIEPLASDVRDWDQLQLLVGSIAASADLPERALPHLKEARDALTEQAKVSAALNRGDLKTRIADVTAMIDRLEPKVPAITAKTDNDAKEKIESDALEAAAAYNQLFGVDLKPEPVSLLERTESNAYTDGKKFYAPPAIAQLPGITWHNVAWQYIGLYLPVFTFDSKTDESHAVMYSYSDVLPMLIRQLGLVKSVDQKSWGLYLGGVAWIVSALQKRDFTPGSDLRPLRSFEHPGSAYHDKTLGDDPQVGHYSELKPGMDPHSASGVGNKAFYEAAQRVGVERAGKIWISALSCLKGQKNVSYQQFADCLVSVSEGDRAKIVEALHVVGLDVANSEPVVEKKRGK
jgi:Thermolysin metallopeptidase, alpha-helical domain